MKCIINRIGTVALLVSLAQFSTQDSLKAVQIAFRHGDRNPIRTYANDPYKDESFWPEGLGAMTYKGKERLYNFGKYLKERYGGVSGRNILIFSSDTNRTKVSGMAAIAGFRGQAESVLKTLEWKNPTDYGIQVIPDDQDKTIIIHHKCPKNDVLFGAFLQKSEVMLEFYEKNHEVFELANKYSGEPKPYKYFSRDFVLLADALLIERSRNLTLPDWAEHLYVSGQLELVRNSIYSFFMGTEEMKRLRGGYLMNNLIDQFDKVIDATPSPTLPGAKMILYSGHDSTIADWLILLGVYDKGNYGIPYGSAVFLELHESESQDEEYYIKIYYRNRTDSEPLALEMPNCRDPCDFERFKILVAPILVENRDEECKMDKKSDSGSIGSFYPHLNDLILPMFGGTILSRILTKIL